MATQGAFANIMLPKALRQARREGHFTDRDAAFTSELVHGTLRAIGRLDWVIARHVDRPLADLDPRVLVVGYAWAPTSSSTCAYPTMQPSRRRWTSHAST